MLPAPELRRAEATRRVPGTRRAAGAGWAIIALVLAACSSSPSPGPSTAHPTDPASPGPSQPVASPSPTIRGSTIPPLPTGPDRLRLEQVASGLDAPVGIVAPPDGSGRVFVLERAGRIRIVERDGTLRQGPFVDLTRRILSGGERGLLGLAFHPRFVENGRLFVHYSRAGDGSTVVSELTAGADRASADPGSERILLTQSQPYANHNGGQLAFGPDGYLYLGLGDGGAGSDPLGNGQNTGVLLGKILRLDVDSPATGGRAYAIPPDNPFTEGGIQPGGGLPEIWAFGLRNPWQFSFDPEGGDLYIGDVGQSRWEEINRQPGDSRGGENYGWAEMEGRHCFREGCDQSGFVKPIAEYSHDLGCSVTGGHVYRGTAQPELVGVYVFGDYCSGRIFTLQVDEGTITPKEVLQSDLAVSAFGTDEAGEILVADLTGGAIYRIVVDG